MATTTFLARKVSPGENRKTLVFGVLLDQVGGLVLGREVIWRWWCHHSRDLVEVMGSEEDQGIPPLPPGVADPFRRVQDDERAPGPGEVIANGETGLATAHYDRVEHSLSHVCSWSLCRNVWAAGSVGYREFS
jgi:hypothetical protein